MRVSRKFNDLIGIFMVINLVPFILAEASRLDFLANNLSYRLFHRSLPGSLITAPQGAVGYQPAPGPVANNAWPTETDTAATGATASQDLSHESRQESVGIDGTARPQDNVAILTGTVTGTHGVMATTQTATAGRDVALTSTRLFFLVLVTVLQL
ncbi:hypothetical protein ETB97_009630 [Aspergillus alliaceus]|uniref:Uncharacterized protein n=1 Tax=Petromyces alliaceus TaxID=209559 RepID=A0A8H6AAM6_PETAA|nr:hypothetical protein ETB97_009630 [Aspergillus burnettii]